jgi:phosphate:Na+ symporter
MLSGARDALTLWDRKLISDTKKLDDIIDQLNTAIKTDLTSLGPDRLSEADHHRLEQILIFATHIEQASDTVERNLLPHTSND